jgi:hypothetical protein
VAGKEFITLMFIQKKRNAKKEEKARKEKGENKKPNSRN